VKNDEGAKAKGKRIAGAGSGKRVGDCDWHLHLHLHWHTHALFLFCFAWGPLGFVGGSKTSIGARGDGATGVLMLDCAYSSDSETVNRSHCISVPDIVVL
jgi:hypothetical protein